MFVVSRPPTVPPLVAMIGGGQLARMTHQAAIALGQTLRVLAVDADDPAAQVTPDVVIGSHTDLDDLRRAADGAHALTFDHEHVPTELLAKLVADGELEPVEVDGWPGGGYLRAGQVVPRGDTGTALLCPFDPLIFFRPRVARLFGFHYRIEIYTPAAKRQYGYYVWPLLADGQLVGRVDLKADRDRDALHVVGAFAEPDQAPGQVAAALAGELHGMASWLGLGGVSVGERGDLVDALRAALR
ncbi:N5-carboxyaminoimidazole ribonucleotide synthase [Mycobacterium talmoniae]|uniref:N5-carboxyaminoimidazole ribonucleotide synthase n=1 Tax=Mycobacterium talmoniae TaxID=1858794 RepID=A0A2S8BJ81_9MYCO|nr:N5-carboxyaminoimidazole ribonucleotide synthase [Mycobacterium talmoniae]